MEHVHVLQNFGIIQLQKAAKIVITRVLHVVKEIQIRVLFNFQSLLLINYFIFIKIAILVRLTEFN
jgi:hypothetical protein